MERWFQNTRGLVIVILAVATCALLLAIEPGDGFPTGVSGVLRRRRRRRFHHGHHRDHDARVDHHDPRR